MNKLLIVPGLVLVLLSAIVVSRAGDVPGPTSAADFALGQQQVERLWADFAKPDLAALDQFVALGFQSLHGDGARDWAQERLLVSGLKITPYVLTDYKVTRNGDTLLVTYQCRVGETIADARLAKESTPRLDIFLQVGGEWKLLSHVNVREITPSTGLSPMMIANAQE
jgi:hypothetical protein